VFYLSVFPRLEDPVVTNTGTAGNSFSTAHRMSIVHTTNYRVKTYKITVQPFPHMRNENSILTTCVVLIHEYVVSYEPSNPRSGSRIAPRNLRRIYLTLHCSHRAHIMPVGATSGLNELSVSVERNSSSTIQWHSI